ncbi:uncharacterized protein CFAP97D2 [Discoglossus pictus]
MHRSYQPILPCGNKYLQQKWDKTYYDEHKQKVKAAKPMVDTNSPHTYVHLNMKLKKLKLEEERLTVIERDNRLLLEKMSTIMRTKGRIDNKNNYEAKSLNKEKRAQELLTISRENQSILDRISKCEPQYQVEKWHEDWIKAEKYMDSIAKYPRGWYLPEQEKKSKRKTTATSKVSKKRSTARGDRQKVEEKDENKRKEPKKKEEEKVVAVKAEEAKRKKEEKVPHKSQTQSENKEENTAKNNNEEVVSEDQEDGKGYDTDEETKSEKSEGSHSEEEDA